MHAHDRRQLEYYEEAAATFDVAQRRDNRNHRKKILAVLESLRLQAGDTVLEVGAGTGIHAEFVASHAGVNLAAVDLSPGMLRAARKRLGDDAWVVAANGVQLPFADAAFDGVYGNGVLHHVAQPAAVVSEMARVLRPGRRLAITEPNRIFPTNAWAWLTRPEERGMRRMAPAELARWAARADLADVACRPLPLYTPPFPRRLVRVYDSVDRLLHKAPVLRHCSIMLLLTARKPQRT